MKVAGDSIIDYDDGADDSRSGPAMHDLSQVWNEVSSWPTDQRQALATRLLKSLQQETHPTQVSRERQAALQKLIGIWKTDKPPNDEQVEQILKETRSRKFG